MLFDASCIFFIQAWLSNFIVTYYVATCKLWLQGIGVKISYMYFSVVSQMFSGCPNRPPAIWVLPVASVVCLHVFLSAESVWILSRKRKDVSIVELYSTHETHFYLVRANAAQNEYRLKIIESLFPSLGQLCLVWSHIIIVRSPFRQAVAKMRPDVQQIHTDVLKQINVAFCRLLVD